MPSQPHPYRVVAEFTNGFLKAETLSAAFRLGVIDALIAKETVPGADLCGSLTLDPLYGGMLLDMLVSHGVLTRKENGVALTGGLRAALAYRDLLETRLEFGRIARRTMFEFYASSVQDPYRFQGRLHSFKFDTRPNYPPAIRPATEHWVRFISTYTRYSAPRLLERHDYSSYRRILDIGGNNGELAIQTCRKYPQLQVTIFDIPVVCDIGADHVRAAGLSDRISFIKGDLRQDTLPEGFDAVVFSSFLHDHDEDSIAQFTGKAYGALRPGGDVIIWETHQFDLAGQGYPESDMDLFPFVASFGPPNRYIAHLQKHGFKNIQVATDDEIRFLHTTASR